MTKYRSKTNYKEIFDGDKQGYNLGLDSSIFLKTESSPRTFSAPSIGTQGKSTSAASPSTDISASLNSKLRIAVSGGAVVSVTLTTTGKTTGTLIATELESKINAALLADGQDARVWVEYAASLYVVHNQSTGLSSTVVITDGATLDIAAELNLGVANGGTELAGTDDTDFLLYTTGGPTFTQPIESNAHRSGRFHSNIIKSKKMAEWKVSTYVNMSGDAGASLDAAVKLLWKGLLGTEEIVSNTRIRYTQGTPNLYMSLVRVSTIFGEYYTGAYVKNMTLTFPGDGPAMCEWEGKAQKRTIAALMQINGAVNASASVIVDDNQEKRSDIGSHVMIVDADGRTIVAGADGSLTISDINTGTHTLTLSTTVTAVDNSYVVPWNPGAVQQSGRDAIFTDLAGTFKFTQGGSSVCATNISLKFANDHFDRDNCFGADSNDGFVAGQRLTMTLSVTFDLNSSENMSEVVQSSTFTGFDPEIVLGAGSGRNLRIRAPKWIPAVPAIEVPENGVTPVTLEGILYQSAPGQKDPIIVDFL